MGSEFVDQIKKKLVSTKYALPFPTATKEQVRQTEVELGFELPELLKSCYLEISNGGFGPGLGIIGIENGCRSDLGNIVQTFLEISNSFVTTGKEWKPFLLPFCAWGCAMFSCVMCDATNQIFTFEEGDVYPQNYTLADFFDLWMAGKDILSYDENIYYEEKVVTNPFTRQQDTIRIRRRRK